MWFFLQKREEKEIEVTLYSFANMHIFLYQGLKVELKGQLKNSYFFVKTQF